MARVTAPGSSEERTEHSIVVIGVGGNVGDSLSIFQAAAERLRQLVDPHLVAASLFRTPPVGPPQADFVNSAFLVETALSEATLLSVCQRIEIEKGRVRGERWGPRTLDLDLLWSARGQVSGTGLEIPHPELTRRKFALVPLLELVPGARCPLTGTGYQSLVEQFHSERIECVAGPDWVWQQP